MQKTNSPPKTTIKPQKRAILLWAGYLLLAIILTWPTAQNLFTHLPGDGGDDPALAWNLWWIKHALLNLGQNPFHTTYLFYPIGINLAFYTLTVLNGVTALPVTLNLGVVAASNLHLLFTFVTGGVGAFLLTRYLLATAGNRPAVDDHLIWASAAIAGGFYAFAGSKLFYVALGQFNIASNHWVPLAVLYILKTHRQPHRRKNALVAGLFITLQAWAEMTYASFLLVFLGLYWLYRLVAHVIQRYQHKNTSPSPHPSTALRTSLPISPSLLPHLQAALALGVTFTLGIAPILAQMLPDLLAEGDFFVEGSGFADTFSADLLGFVIPTMHHPWLGHAISQTHIGQPGSVTGFDKGQHIYIGVVLLGLLAVAALTRFRRPQVRFWLLAAGVFALLSLGPVIVINGYATGINGPFTILQSLPFFKGNRYPSRYSVMLILSLSVIAAFGLAEIGRLIRSTRNSQFKIHNLILTLIAGLFLFEHLSLPLPQSDMRPPPAYQIIAADPGNFTVLDIPFAWRNGFRITGALTPQFMFGQFYQTTHQKKLIQGNTSRNPQFKFQYFTDAPVINSLLALETGKTLPPERWATDRAIAADVLRFFNIKYIVVRPEPDNPFGHFPQNTIPYIKDVLPVEQMHNAPAIKIYRVRPANESKKQLQISVDSPLARLYFGEGWGLLTPGNPIAAQRKTVRLMLPLSRSARQVTLQIRLPGNIQPDTQSVSLNVNDWHSDPQPVTEDWQTVTFDLPPAAIQPGLNNVYLQFERVARLPQPAPNVPPLDVTVTSAGQEVGSFGHIFVNGHNISANQRGYNVALLRPNASPKIAHFDTHLDAAASTNLVDFLATTPTPAIVAVAAADEASANLSEAAVRALQSKGAAADLRGCFRCSHAFISLPNGSVFEALEPLRPAGVTTGLGLTEPSVAAIVREIGIKE